MHGQAISEVQVIRVAMVFRKEWRAGAILRTGVSVLDRCSALGEILTPGVEGRFWAA